MKGESVSECFIRKRSLGKLKVETHCKDREKMNYNAEGASKFSFIIFSVN